MATIARTAKAGGGTNFNSGQTIDPAEVNTDLNTAYTEINGNLDDGNIETATIPGAKSLRGTEISDPSSPSSNDALLYVKDDSGVSKWATKDAAGNVLFPGYTALAGTGTGKHYLGGLLTVTTTTVGTDAGTAEKVLHSLTVPAAALGATGSAGGEYVEVDSIGVVAVNAQNKTIRLRLNGVAGTIVVDSGTVATSGAEWKIHARIFRSGVNLINAVGTFLLGVAGGASGAVSVHRFNILFSEAMTLSSAWTIDVTGQNGTATADDIQASASWLTLYPWKG